MTLRVLLRDLTPGQQYALQFRSNNGEQTSDWSQVQRFTTTNDTIAPSMVQNLSFYDSGTSFIADWDPVTTQASSPVTPIQDLKDYHVQVANNAAGPWKDYYIVGTHFEFSTEMNQAAFGTYQNHLYLQVRARDNSFNESAIASAAVDPAIPSVPSIPTVDTYLGALRVKWNGLDSNGGAMPKNFNYCEVHVGTSATFAADTSTFHGRIFADATALVLSDLAYDTDYWVRLIAVNLTGKRSAPTNVSVKIRVTRLSGLDIQNGTLTAEEINWKATNIPGGDAYYSTSQPTSPIGAQFNVGDVWYDTDNGYAAYTWNGTTWVLDTTIGFIPGGKIIAGTISGDRIATNFFSAAFAHIGTSYIDAAYITSVNAASITTGSLTSNGTIIGGPVYGTHTEMRSDGFYVMVPDPSGALDGSGNPVTLPQVKMGTGAGDNFSIVDPNATDSTLASIDTNGVISGQGLYIETDPIIQGQQLVGGLIKARTQLVGEGVVGPITGLNQSGAQGIRSEYGLGQYSFAVEAGRTYEIVGGIDPASGAYLVYDGGEIQHNFRLQVDQRTPTDITNGVAPTSVTTSSPIIFINTESNLVNTWGYRKNFTMFYRATTTGVVTIGYSMQLNAAPSDGVIKVTDNTYLRFKAIDLGRSKIETGQPNTYGASLYSWTAPPPPPPPSVQNYSWSGHYNWVRSYKSNNGYMTNTNGLAYQGQDPSGYNGNQHSHFGFSQVDFASMLSGASNISISLYLYYSHWYNNSGGTAVIGYHNNWGDPGTAGSSGGSYNLIQRGGVPKPGSFSIDVSGWAGAMQNGSFRGIALGPGPSSSYTYYGYASDCALTVNYTK
jgi:hypothetical protein